MPRLAINSGRRKNLAPRARPGSLGYDVVIGARRKHFDSHTAAHRYGTDQQNKGVHAGFVIVDSATKKREEFKRSGAKGNPPASIHKEVAAAAKDVARRGGHGYAGESLPNLMTGDAVRWINDNQRVFQQMVSTQRIILSKRGILKRNAKKRNPEAAAAEMYEKFSGRPSKHVTTIVEDVHVHKNLSQLGILAGLKVRTLSGYDVTLEFLDESAEQSANPKKHRLAGWVDRRFKTVGKFADQFKRAWVNPSHGGPVLLCSNEKGDSLYARGGDQSLDIGKLHMDDFKRDSMVIGEVWLLGYLGEKSFDKWKEKYYVHPMGDEKAHPKIGKKKDLWDDAKPPRADLFGSGELPTLIYDPLSALISFSGGVYRVEPEGIVD